MITPKQSQFLYLKIKIGCVISYYDKGLETKVINFVGELQTHGKNGGSGPMVIKFIKKEYINTN